MCALQTECKYCKNDLAKTGARFCAECGHWQIPLGAFLGKLSIGNLPLYGAIFVLLFTTFRSFIVGDAAELSFHSLGCERGGAQVVVSNSGRAAGLITKPVLIAGVTGSMRKNGKLEMRVQGKSGNTAIIEHSTSPRLISLEASLANRLFAEKAFQENEDQCKIGIVLETYEDDTGTPGIISKELCSCREFIK